MERRNRFLACLVSITLGRGCRSIDLYLMEICKCCPNLKSLKVSLAYTSLDSLRLTNNLWSHCPSLETLILESDLPMHHLEALARHSSACGLRKRHVSVEGTMSGLVQLIIQHASILEDLRVSIGYRSMERKSWLQGWLIAQS
ncbi:MAG: hypothetical protein J3R72DRAFT_501359 [Linnemannia gamsii]|nr:MAG: hypothetical protein J3R72DRAFT_501359 [Linnemannia gamsii]